MITLSCCVVIPLPLVQSQKLDVPSDSVSPTVVVPLSTVQFQKFSVPSDIDPVVSVSLCHYLCLLQHTCTSRSLAVSAVPASRLSLSLALLCVLPSLPLFPMLTGLSRCLLRHKTSSKVCLLRPNSEIGERGCTCSSVPMQADSVAVEA